jgi:hypothetical protein
VEKVYITDSRRLAKFLLSNLNKGSDVRLFKLDKIGDNETIYATYKGYKVEITYGYGRSLFISANDFINGEFKELIDVSNEAMGVGPIAAYDCYDYNGSYVYPTVEWNVEDPEQRIQQILNNEDLNGNCYNITYENLKINNEKIFGIYPGFLTVKDLIELEDFCESELFYLIDTLGKSISLAAEIAKKKKTVIDLTEELYAIDFLITQASSFGVVVPNPTLNDRIAPTESFILWYSWWAKYYEETLTDNDRRLYDEMYAKGEDVSLLFRPSGDWEEYSCPNKVMVIGAKYHPSIN